MNIEIKDGRLYLEVDIYDDNTPTDDVNDWFDVLLDEVEEAINEYYEDL